MSNLKEQEYFYIGNYEFLKNTCHDLKDQKNKEWSELLNDISGDEENFHGFPEKNESIILGNQATSQNNEDYLKNLLNRFYRKEGYKYADLNPIYEPEKKPSLSFIGNNQEVKNYDEKLGKKYLGKCSIEFDHIGNKEKYDWLAQRYEGNWSISNEEKKQILQDIMEAESFEQFLHIKFPGAKRFSIEGGEAAITIFETFMKRSSELGLENIVIGMAHRGRLNFLTKICGENYGFIFGQFAGKNAFDESLGISGDVKYHLGSSNDRTLKNGKKVHLALLPNPSHLETINPIVIGNVRAKQDDYGDIQRKKIIPFLIHGDASFAGQGIVYETLAMNNLPAYDVGGVVHLIIDNQVGFTASATETRSTKYSSDLVKMLDIPIFHINGDSPEDAFHIAQIAAEYRARFGGDIMINLVCYRRYGHNEGDEPNFTQPQMYSKIISHPTTYNIYKKSLIENGIIKEDEAQNEKKKFHDLLESELQKFTPKKKDDLLVGNWQDVELTFDDNKINKTKTAIKKELFIELEKLLKNIPSDIKPNNKVAKLIEGRIHMLETGQNIDWGVGEMLAFASLLNEGKNIRISGEDVVRGTFAHRHAAIISQDNDKKYFYYKDIATNNARFDVYNSILSEYGVLGFDYGYSWHNPENLVIWEAQFGDFANGAQIIFDQMLSGGEQKWMRMSNLVMMLPHGYEGQGPEHSSARIERFLQLCGQYNMRVIQPTTPANLFHALRRQILDKTKKPLVIFTPKSLLRHKLVISQVGDFIDENSSFKETILTMEATDKYKKLILCSGKIYYDLYEKILENKINDIALLRIEQLYPFPLEQIKDVIKKFVSNGGKDIIWCQDEPKNMGSYNFVMESLDDLLFELGLRLKYMGRKTSAATACGSTYEHNKEQKKIIEECLK